MGPANDINANAIVVLIASVRDVGAPSIAEGYGLVAQTSNGTIMTQRIAIPPHFQFAYPNRTITLEPTMDLGHKTIAAAIPHNTLKRGYLVFSVPGTSFGRISALAQTFVLNLKDIHGSVISCSRSANDQTGPANQLDFPGVDEQ